MKNLLALIAVSFALAACESGPKLRANTDHTANFAQYKTYTFPDAKNIGMYTSCKNQGTAWDVIKFATSKDQDGQLLNLTGQMPLRTDLPTTYADYFTKNPDYKLFAAQAARTTEVPNVNNSVQIWQTFRDAWTSSVIFGKTDPTATFTTAAAAIDKLAASS